MSDPAPNTTFLAPEPSELSPLFPGYEIEMLIATGGMGAVYRAVQKSLNRTVAIKILPGEFSNDASFCAGFEAEAKAMARLNHINLVGVYDFGEVNGMLYIIMEYVAGKSLFHSSNGNAIDPSEVIRLVTGICEGLAHAHEHGILHRDIKPSNILLDPNAQPKIGDFGLARPVETEIQEGEEIFGTPHYTAPEVVDSPNSVDYRADIFSVGVLLHELLTGLLPANDRRSASAISHCDPRFDAIIRRATHHNPDGRYTSAVEIAQDLQNIATTAGPKVLRTAKPTPPRGRPRPAATTRHFTKTKSSGSPVLIILFIVVIGGIIAFLLHSNKQISEPTYSPPPTTKPSLPKPGKSSTTSDNSTSQQLRIQQQKEKREQERQHLKERQHLAEERQQQKDKEEKEEEEKRQQLAKERQQERQEDLAAEPEFDTSSFLKRAVTIMNESAAPIIADRDKKFVVTIEGFEKRANFQIRKIENRNDRERVEDLLKTYIEECKTSKKYLPEKFTEELRDGDLPEIEEIPEIKEIHQDYVKKQEPLDADLHRSLAQLASTYTYGLQKQIERLKPTKDESAIALLKQEISTVRTDTSYFPNLILGTLPQRDEEQ